MIDCVLSCHVNYIWAWAPSWSSTSNDWLDTARFMWLCFQIDLYSSCVGCRVDYVLTTLVFFRILSRSVCSHFTRTIWFGGLNTPFQNNRSKHVRSEYTLDLFLFQSVNTSDAAAFHRLADIDLLTSSKMLYTSMVLQGNTIDSL